MHFTIVLSRCLGSTQHLKDRHGSGYILEVKLGHRRDNNHDDDDVDEEEELDKFCRVVEELFPGASLVEKFGNRVTFKIAQESVGTLSRAFSWFEEGRNLV